ncbi:MMPL family transporter [Patulibacter sp.]|uniref:MMPL family transporter n=1 Tax=Patulibacter sp. TaxID=1912859 RepID=UPI002721B63B|nr:MMPL family transporter [Patulibacter sp.]MDO9409610.1 MMPL family transporter [Patulibacter sp.]
MPRLTRLVVARRRLVALCWVVLALAGAWAASGIGDALSRSFDAPGRPAFEANERIVRAYGSGGRISPIVLVARPEDGRDVRDQDVRDELREAVDRVARAVPGSRVVSSSGATGEGLDSEDGRASVAYLFPPVGRPAPDENPQALAAARKAAAGTEVGGRPLGVTGIEALSDDSGGGGGVGLLVETLVGGLGALIVLAWVFSSALAFVPLVVAAVSILTTFLLLRALAALTEVSFVVQFLVGLIGLGIAIDYSLLVVFRWREERAAGREGPEAVEAAMRTAGRAVAVSGVTVAIGLLALVVVPVPFIRSIGFGGLLIPIVSVLAALTLLPVLLLGVGERLDRRWAARHAGTTDAGAGHAGRDATVSPGWIRWATFVVRRRWIAAVAGLLVLFVLAGVATTLRPGQPTVDSLSSGGGARSALQHLERHGLGTGAVTPIEVLTTPDAAGDVERRLRETSGIRGVVSPTAPEWRRGGAALTVALPTEDSASDRGRETLDRVRDAAEKRDFGGRVGGPAAQDRDLTEAIYASFPVMVLLIAVITFALLARALRSVVLPIKAILLNVLSVGSSFGIVVLVWQQGGGSELLGGVPATGSITTWVPLAIFAFLYGLSMDYEVFILSRVREEYDRTGSTDEAVIEGLGRTGRLVTSAALVLFLAFVALGAAPNTEIRILATGLAAGILLDATVVRALVVPALVTLFGKANWWLPAALERRWRPR